MRVEKHHTGWWVVVRGDENYPQYFAFFVDADRSAWSKWITQAARYSTREAADKTAQQIRERNRARRKNRTQA